MRIVRLPALTLALWCALASPPAAPGAVAQVPADPTGTRPPVLGTPPGAATSPTPSAPTGTRPAAPGAAPAAEASETRPAEPRPGEAKPAAAPEAAGRKIPQITGFPELIEGQGTSRDLLEE
jgi:hypothetical protein